MNNVPHKNTKSTDCAATIYSKQIQQNPEPKVALTSIRRCGRRARQERSRAANPKSRPPSQAQGHSNSHAVLGFKDGRGKCIRTYVTHAHLDGGEDAEVILGEVAERVHVKLHGLLLLLLLLRLLFRRAAGALARGKAHGWELWGEGAEEAASGWPAALGQGWDVGIERRRRRRRVGVGRKGEERGVGRWREAENARTEREHLWLWASISPDLMCWEYWIGPAQWVTSTSLWKPRSRRCLGRSYTELRRQRLELDAPTRHFPGFLIASSSWPDRTNPIRNRSPVPINDTRMTQHWFDFEINATLPSRVTYANYYVIPSLSKIKLRDSTTCQEV